MNKITLIGNLTRDVEKRTTNNGKTVASFTIAVDRRGSKENKVTDFFRINAWNAMGENCARFLAKGSKVAVTGEMQARTYTANDGSTKMSLDVLAEEVEFLSRMRQPGEDEETSATEAFKDISPDEIPF